MCFSVPYIQYLLLSTLFPIQMKISRSSLVQLLKGFYNFNAFKYYSTSITFLSEKFRWTHTVTHTVFYIHPLLIYTSPWPFAAFASLAYSCKRSRIFSLVVCKTHVSHFVFFLSFLTKTDFENGSLSLHS